MLRDLGVVHYKILLTIVPSYPERDGAEARRMLEDHGYPLFGSSIREAKAFKLAALSGILVQQVKSPRAAACWADYTAVGEEMMK